MIVIAKNIYNSGGNMLVCIGLLYHHFESVVNCVSIMSCDSLFHAVVQCSCFLYVVCVSIYTVWSVDLVVKFKEFYSYH